MAKKTLKKSKKLAANKALTLPGPVPKHY